MSRKFITVCIFLFLAISVPAYALNVTTGLPTTNWSDSPFIKTADLPPDSGNSSSAYVSENNFGSGANMAGQTFNVTTGFTLDKIAITISGGPTDLTFQMYDLGTGHSAAWNDPATVDITTATALWGSALAYHYYGGGSEAVAELDFQGAEEVALAASHKYIFVINEATAGALTWYRTGVPTNYPNVSGYRAASATTLGPLRGDSARNFGMAVYQIPEPATIAMLGLGGLALLRRKR